MPKSVKVLNRWGMDVDDITESQKKRLKNQNQSKIDGFFKNPPKGEGSEDNFKRISHADTDMERALKLSRETMNAVLTSARDGSFEDEAEKAVAGREGPGYAYVGPSVRGREERKK